MNNRYPFLDAFNFSVYQKKFCNVIYQLHGIKNGKSAQNHLSCPGKYLFEVFWQLAGKIPVKSLFLVKS